MIRHLTLVLATAGSVLVPLTAHAETGPGPAFQVQDSRIADAAGLARSTRSSSLFYTHNDAGDSARIFAIGSTGRTRAVIRLTNAQNVDWEDMTSGPGNSLWIGDVGNRGLTRSEVAAYRITEPRKLRTKMKARATKYRLRFADGRHDAEAILVHPTTGRLYVVTKSATGAGIYQAPAALSATGVNTLTRVSEAPAGVTAGSYSPDGRRFVLSTADAVYTYTGLGHAPSVTAKPTVLNGSKSLLVAPGGSTVLAGTAGRARVYKMSLSTTQTANPAPTASLLTTPQGAYTDPRTQLALQWSPPSSTSVTGYRFGYTTTDARETDPTWTSTVIAPANADRPFVFDTLVSGATYTVFVEAVYANGTLARTTLSGQTASPMPGAVATPTVTNLTQTTMTVNWKAPVQAGSSAVDGYQVGWGTWDSAMLPATARSMDLTNFAPGTSYKIRVRAHNAAGYGPWSEVTVRTPSAEARPSAPTAPSITNLASTSMTMNWKPSAQPGTSAIDGYQVGWGTWDSAMLPATARSMNLTNFTANTTYTIRVRAHNASGYSDWSTVTVRTPAATTSPTPPPATSTKLLGLPRRVTSVYWTTWNAQIDITQVPQNYNTLYLFSAPRGGAEGGVVWNSATPTTSQLDVVRGRGQRVILSTGGAGNGINFHSRYVSQNFVNSIVSINAKLGGTLTNPKIDGVDFNTFEAEATPNTGEYLWMFGELKRLFGQNFIICAPPAPWKDEDKSMIRQALASGVMDYAAPQYYDGPGLADPSYIINNVRDWVRNVAGGDASKIAVGFGMENLPNYSTVGQIQTAWDAIEREFPAIRGAFVWQHRTDADRGWTFSNNINPRVLD